MSRTGLIVNAADFSNLETREDELMAALGNSESHVIIDLTEVAVQAPDDVFGEVLFFARLVAERARRHGSVLPKVVVVPPRRPMNTFTRLLQLHEKTGIDMDLAASATGAKSAFPDDTQWRSLYDQV